MKNNQQLDLKTLEVLDQLLSQNHKPIKNSEGGDSLVYTKIYEVFLKNPHPKIIKLRLWFDKKTKKGTIKVRQVPYSHLVAVGTYLLIQAGILIQQTFIS